jgi:hypothetical protein
LATEYERRSRSARVLTALLFASVLLLWVPARWAASLFQMGVFILAMPYRLRWTPVSIPLAAAVLWGLAQLALGRTIYRWETWNAVLTWFTQLVCFLLAFQLFADERIRNRFLKSLFYFGFALSVIATLQLFTAEGKVFWLFPSGYKDLVLGPFVYHNQYAAFVEMVFPLAVVAALQSRERALIYAGMAAALYASVIASASRAGAALVTLELIAILALALFQRRITLRTAGLASGFFVMFVACFGAVVGWQALWQRLHAPDPFAIRRELLHSTLDMIHERPAMGFGLGTWSTAYPAHAYSDDGLFSNQAHNDWAQWAAEGGLPFFLFILSIAVWSIRPAARSLWGVGVVSVFLHCLVDYPIQRPALGGLFFVLLGVLAAHEKNLDL